MTTQTQTQTTFEPGVIAPVLTIKDGRVVANSRDVAIAFGKRHADVLRAIEDLECSREFTERNFALSAYRDSTGRELRAYDLTRDGFVFLVMGFTGREAAKFKEAYILAFNRMEEELRQMGLAVHDLDGEDLTAWGLPLRKVDTASRLISTALRVYGPDAARRLWEKDKSLPNLRRFSIERLVETPEDDSAGCLRHLLRIEARSGMTIGQMLDLAMRDSAAAGSLRDFGIILDPGIHKGYVAFADSHPFLRGAFAGTQWAGAWRRALLLLLGAKATNKKLIFAGQSSLAVLVPKEAILNLRHGSPLN
ncbi:Rha family phage regulatory protein [Bosea sp. OAE506]|uniref:Rha family transcriptional regulator n=1 Tax=Bosea sp. OAE506 TaxID=2663870 RepID=UPI0019DC5612